MFDQTCTNCGERFSRSANFCPKCGTPAKRGSASCRYCAKDIPAAARHCPYCGKSTEGSERPAVVGNTWAREPDDFATRLEIDDLEGTLRRDLIVEPGTRAIILIDGRNLAGAVGPGRYTLKSFMDKLSLPSLRRRATALLVDTGEVDLDLTIGDVYTSDPLKLTLDCHVAVDIRDPMAFFTNLLKGGRSFSLSQLRSYLYDEIQDAAQECVGQRSAADLHTNLARKQEFSTHVAAHLDETLRQVGLGFSRVRTMNFRHARWDELTQKEEQYFLQISEEEAEQGQRKRLFDIFDRNEIQAIVEETRKLEHYEQRVQLRERMRRAVLSDQFNELTTEQEMETFLREMDRQKLIDDDEWARLQRSTLWKQQDEIWTRGIELDDRDRSRSHLLARLELENEYDLKQLELLQRADLEPAQLELELDLERQLVEGKQEIETRRQGFRLAQARQEAEFRREQEQLDGIARREEALAEEQQRLSLELSRAETAAQIAAVEREQDRLDLELGMLALEKIKAVQRKDEEERKLLDLRVQRERLQMELEAEERRLQMQLVELRETREFELARMDRLKDLPPEAVVAVSDAERGRIIADMQRTEAMKGMSEQQILAIVAENRPEAAQALAEIARAAADGQLAEEQRAMYERLLEQNKEFLAEKDRASQRVEEAWRASADKIQETAMKALDSQREGMTEIARATSHPPAEQQSPTVVVTGPGGVPTVIGGVPGAAAGGGVQCRRCGVMSQVGTRFCQNCGYEFFATGDEG